MRYPLTSNSLSYRNPRWPTPPIPAFQVSTRSRRRDEPKSGVSSTTEHSLKMRSKARWGWSSEFREEGGEEMSGQNELSAT